jgi:hypothetical protein
LKNRQLVLRARGRWRESDSLGNCIMIRVRVTCIGKDYCIRLEPEWIPGETIQMFSANLGGCRPTLGTCACRDQSPELRGPVWRVVFERFTNPCANGLGLIETDKFGEVMRDAKARFPRAIQGKLGRPAASHINIEFNCAIGLSKALINLG